jgi:hypothetical protein
MKNQDFTSTLNTHLVSETNAVIDVSKKLLKYSTKQLKRRCSSLMAYKKSKTVAERNEAKQRNHSSECDRNYTLEVENQKQ